MGDLPEEKMTEPGGILGLGASLGIIVTHQKGDFHPSQMGKAKSVPGWTHQLPNSLVKSPNFQGITQHSHKGRMDTPALGAFIALLFGFYSRLPPRLGGNASWVSWVFKAWLMEEVRARDINLSSLMNYQCAYFLLQN